MDKCLDIKRCLFLSELFCLRSGICALVFAFWYLRFGICALVFALWYLRSGICALGKRYHPDGLFYGLLTQPFIVILFG